MFEDSGSFSLYIEQIVKEKKCSHLDAVLKYCQENFIDPEDMKPLISKALKQKIEANFIEMNYLPKHAKLDV
jgi:hypothetical protein